jgi:hypothetical protein
MGIIHSGTFTVSPEDLNAVLVGFTRGTFDFFPHGVIFTRDAYLLDPGNNGTIIVGLNSGDTVHSSADGNFTIAAAPAGFRPSTNLRFRLSGEWELFGAGDSISFGAYLGAVAYSQAGPGYFSSMQVFVDIPDYRPWPLLVTDLYEVFGALPVSYGIRLEREVGRGFELSGHYDIVIFWWLLPDVTPCGQRDTSHLAYASEKPVRPSGAVGDFELLDPNDPDAAPHPVIQNVEPNHGRAGTAVEIIGSGFGDDANVQFDGVDADDIVVHSQYLISCVAPLHANGFANIAVINPDGGSS